MRRRLTAILMIVALAMQALVFTPASFASGLSSSTTTLSDHCSDAEKDSSCPCCPEGFAMPAGCMSFCAGFAAHNEIKFPALHVPVSASIPFIAPAAITHTSAPPDPPPIR